MPIPTAGTIVHEFLKVISDGRRHNIKDVHDLICESFAITSEEALQRVPSGNERLLANRFRNAKFLMRKHDFARFEQCGDVVIITTHGKLKLERGLPAIRYTSTIKK